MAKGRRIPSVMKHLFSQVPSASLRRSSFDRSSGLKTTFDMDYLVPIYVDEVLPGDTFSLSETHLCRLTTLVQPLMDNIMLTTQWFFVPNRLLWDNWEDFITGGDEPNAWLEENPNNSLEVPQVVSPTNGQNGATADGYAVGSIYDYFGLPTGIKNFKHSVLPLRAYNLIWNEYYRDENLQDPIPVFTGDQDEQVDKDPDSPGEKVPYVYTLQKRNKRYDYFTSALISQQKGPAVGIGITGGDSGRLPIQGLGLTQLSPDSMGSPAYISFTPPMDKFVSRPSTFSEVGLDKGKDYGATVKTSYFYGPNGGLPPGTLSPSIQPGYFSLGSPIAYWNGTPRNVDYQGGSAGGSGGKVEATGQFTLDNWPIYVDLGTASSVTINSLRNAITLQHWFEKNARYGTRYVEFLQGHFGVHAGDYRLQRPEYLGGSKTYISVNPVVQNSATEKSGPAATPQGNLAAYALSSNSKKLFTKSFVEHGLIIGLVSLTADLTYQQGLDRSPWIRSSRYDFYFPSFAHLGEQVIYNKEIYCQPDDVMDKVDTETPVNDMPFGYQERYAEYRYKPSKITGLFRSSAAGTLDSWHLSQYFAKLPALNDEFIESNTPIDRALAVSDQPNVLADFFFSCRCVRPMPVYSVPGLRRI